MEAVRQVIDSTLLNGIIQLPKKFENKKVEVIISLSEDKKTAQLIADNTVEKPKQKKRPLGFVTNVPPLPDSFFDPLPEEDLQLWGL